MDLDKLSPQEVVSLELATGMPIVYDYSNGRFNERDIKIRSNNGAGIYLRQQLNNTSF